MTIKMTMADGTVIEGTAEELAELQRLSNGEEEKDDVQPKYKTEDRPAKVGERILITDAVIDEPYENGDVFTVIDIHADNSGDVDVAETSRWIAYYEYEVIIEENGEPVEQAKPKLKVGDYAKVIQSGHGNEGKIVKIIEDGRCGRFPYLTEEISGEEADIHSDEHLDKVELTDEDLTFLKIGREPGEFKVGDIVRVVDNCGGELKEGELYEITSHNGVFEKINGWASHNELIAPAEARVDVDADS